MSNSSLVTYTRITGDRNSPRNHKIDTITIHCYVAQVTAKQGCDYFATSDRQVSSNYVVGYDGSIGLSVPEADRAWTSSSKVNDHRAVTIEVASDTKAPYKVTDKAYSALIALVADICKRNGIKELVWSNTSSDRVNHRNGCNMTVHRDFANTACPGEYLYGKMPDIAKKVNAKLNTAATVTATATATGTTGKTTEVYRVRKAWKDSASQKGAYSSLANAKKVADQNPSYYVFDSNGNVVYPTKKSNEAIAKEVIDGKWGNGAARVAKLTAAGYNYNTIQSIVNKLTSKK